MESLQLESLQMKAKNIGNQLKTKTKFADSKF